MRKIVIIGLDSRDLNKKAASAILSSGLVVGGKRMLGRISELLTGKQTFPIGANLALAAEKIECELETGSGMVTILASGDPLFFGIGRFITERFGNNTEIEITPAVSVMQEAFAKLGTTWEDARFLSLHARGMEGLVQAAVESRKLFLFTDPKNSPEQVAKILCRSGMGQLECAVLEDAGTDSERLTRVKLEEIAGQSFSGLNVMILENKKPVTPRKTRPSPGTPDTAYEHENGMITKSEIRAIVLSKLGVSEYDTVWDIGACSGAVSIEAAAIARFGKVYAIEEQAGRMECLKRNLETFMTQNVIPIHARAPECLNDLKETPDAAFIGGSGGAMDEILLTVAKRLKPDGKLVITLVSTDNLNSIGNLLGKNSFDHDLTMVNISRTKKVKTKKIFTPLTPIFIVEAWRR